MATHVLKIWTGDARGAGTGADVFVRCIGQFGQTYHDLDNGTFERDSVDSFEIDVPPSIGTVNRLEIGHNESGLGSGWYVDHVELIAFGQSEPKDESAIELDEAETKAKAPMLLDFPCNMW